MKGKLSIFLVTSAMVVGLSGMPASAQNQNQPQASQQSQPNCVNAVLTGDKALPESTLAYLKKMPNIILRTFPNGGPLMVDFLARTVASDFSLPQAFLGIVGEANALQRSAIGAALARAAKLYERGGCGNNAQAIAEAIVANGDQRLANAFQATTPEEAPGAIGGAPGAVAGARGRGAVGRSTGSGAGRADGGFLAGLLPDAVPSLRGLNRSAFVSAFIPDSWVLSGGDAPSGAPRAGRDRSSSVSLAPPKGKVQDVEPDTVGGGIQAVSVGGVSVGIGGRGLRSASPSN